MGPPMTDTNIAHKNEENSKKKWNEMISKMIHLNSLFCIVKLFSNEFHFDVKSIQHSTI